ncbi:MAG: sigma-70 family RNA polymerase sigma factor [Pirellulales bacterium]
MSKLGFELLDDDDFHRRLLAGEPEAFEQLIEAIQQASSAYCKYLGVRAADVDDTLQNSYIKLFNHLKKTPNSSAQFRWWWFTIVRNTAYDLFREKRLDTGNDYVETAAGDSISDPGEAVAAAEEANHAFSSLEPEERNALKLYHFDKLGNQTDCAAELGVSLTTFKNWLRNAKRRFYNSLLSKGESSADIRHSR